MTEDDYTMNERDMTAVLTGLKALFSGKYEEARASHPGVALVLDVLADAMVPGARKAAAIKSFEAASEYDRKVAAGVYNLLENMVTQMKHVLAKVGAEKGDAHVEVVSLGGDSEYGCGDPDCENCGGKPFPSDKIAEIIGQKAAEVLGIPLGKVIVQKLDADSMNVVEKALGEDSSMTHDSHTNEIMQALDRMPGSKRPRLTPKKLPS